MTVATTPSYPTYQKPVIASIGGGLDSWAMLLAAEARGILPDVAVFVDVGNCNDRSVPGEWPGTYDYVEQVIKPWCESKGIEWVTLDANNYPCRPLTSRQEKALTVLAENAKAKVGKKETNRLLDLGLIDDAKTLTDNGRKELAEPGSVVGSGSLFEWLWDNNNIPVSGPKRNCTKVAKVERFERWLNDRFPGETCEVWIGFGAEPKEQKRADRGDPYSATSAPEPGEANRVNRFPLIEWDICRCRSVDIVTDAGFQVPFGSACVFCPYGQMTDWQAFANDLPEQFDRVCELEERKTKTENGFKLTIKGWSKKKVKADYAPKTPSPHLHIFKDDKGGTFRVNEVPLREWVQGTPRRSAEACEVCGKAEAVRKDVGCGWDDERSVKEAA